MTTLISAASLASTVNQDGLVIEMLPELQWLDPDKAALVSILQLTGKVEARTRMKHEWRERELRQRTIYATAVDTAASGTINVSAADGDVANPMVGHYLFRPATDEVMLISSESAGAIVVLSVGGAGTTAPLIATVIGEPYIILHESHAEGAAVPTTPFSQQEDSYYNYMMQMDRVVQASDIEQLEEHYGEDQRDADRRAAFIETWRDHDLIMWVGQRTRETTSVSGKRRHLCGGILERIVSNSTDYSLVGSGFTYFAFCEMLRPTTEHSKASSDKMFFAGTNAYMSVASWAEEHLQTKGEDSTFGVKVQTIRTPYGDVKMTREIQFSAQNGMADRAAILDMPQIKRVFLRSKSIDGMQMGGDLHLIQNYDTTNPHISKDLLTGIAGIEMFLEKLHAEAVNIR